MKASIFNRRISHERQVHVIWNRHAYQITQYRRKQPKTVWGVCLDGWQHEPEVIVIATVIERALVFRERASFSPQLACCVQTLTLLWSALQWGFVCADNSIKSTKQKREHHLPASRASQCEKPGITTAPLPQITYENETQKPALDHVSVCVYMTLLQTLASHWHLFMTSPDWGMPCDFNAGAYSLHFSFSKVKIALC